MTATFKKTLIIAIVSMAGFAHAQGHSQCAPQSTAPSAAADDEAALAQDVLRRSFGYKVLGEQAAIRLTTPQDHIHMRAPAFDFDSPMPLASLVALN